MTIFAAFNSIAGGAAMELIAIFIEPFLPQGMVGADMTVVAGSGAIIVKTTAGMTLVTNSDGLG